MAEAAEVEKCVWCNSRVTGPDLQARRMNCDRCDVTLCSWCVRGCKWCEAVFCTLSPNECLRNHDCRRYLPQKPAVQRQTQQKPGSDGDKSGQQA